MSVYAKPWQRFVLYGTMIVLGLALVALGQVKGIVLVVLGALMMYSYVRHRVRSRRETGEAAASPDST